MAKIVDESSLKNGFAEVEGLKWHWVEAGQGQPVVLVHGLPESCLTIPVHLIYPDSDPRQPLYFLGGVEKVIPGYQGRTIIHDSGHFSMQEQPDQVNKALLDFLLD